MFRFENPAFLFLLALPILYRFIQIKRSSFYFSSLALFEDRRGWRAGLDQSLILFRSIIFMLLVLGLARPQWTNTTTEVLTEGIDILLTIDTSGSMQALDFQLNGSEVNRLDVVKNVVSDFISRRPYDRIGMVIFGETAYTQCPLTRDGKTLQRFLEWIRIGIVGDGTAIGSALATSVKRLKDQPTKSKIVILLTDGRNNAGEIAPLRAAEIAKEYGIKVYTIGVGSRGLVPYPQQTPFGVRRTYARLDIDDKTLGEIAQITGGQYYRATQTEELEKIYETIDQLEKTEAKIKEYRENRELYGYFLLGALGILLIEILLGRTVLLRIP